MYVHVIILIELDSHVDKASDYGKLVTALTVQM